MARCECTACGKLFGSVTGFDKHRIGKYTIPDTRRCLKEKELKEKGLTKNDKGVFVRAAPVISSCGVGSSSKKRGGSMVMDKTKNNTPSEGLLSPSKPRLSQSKDSM